MTTTLITGANKGLGKEAARQLLALGHTVYIGARDISRGHEAAEELGASFVQLDVTDDNSVQAAGVALRDEVGSLDILINNAGVPGNGKTVTETTADDLLVVYQVNVFGAVRVTHTMLPILEAASAPTIVNVSSGLGSLAVTTNPDSLESRFLLLAYQSSKTALNMLTTQYAKALPRFRVNAVDPGYTATDLNSHRGTKTVEEGAHVIVQMATVGPDGPTGTFVDQHGPVPW